jgi:hypothetical protein
VHLDQPLRLREPRALARQLDTAIDTIAAHGNRIGQLDEDTLPILLALTAAGCFRTAARLLDGHASTAPPHVLAAAACRYAAWSGDASRIAPHWPRIAQLLAADTPASTRTRIIAAGACHALERTATDLADHATAARARAAAASLTPDRTADPLLAAALALTADSPDATDHTVDGTGDVVHPTGAAYAVLRFVHGTLGAEPDAARHRLTLAPRPLPLMVDELAFGDATITVGIETDTLRTVLHIDQQSGAIPITLLLQPVLTAAPARVTIDGHPAQLRPRATASGVMVPVQLLLDAPRTVIMS